MEDEVKDIADAAIAAPAVEAEIAPAELPAQSEELAVVAAPVAAEKQAPKPKGKPGRPRKVAAPVLETTADAPVAPAVKPVRKVKAKVAVKAAKPAPKPAAKISTLTLKTNKNEVTSVKSATAKQKDYIMNATTTEMTETIQTAMKEAAEKAKAALEKSQAALGDMGTFTKGNVEAVVESTKILATGLQEMTKSYAAETKTVVETMQAEIKELAAVKSPAEFFEKQNALLRKQFDAAVAATSKNSEAMLKLASEAFQPISNRVSLAVEKIKQAA